MKGFSAKNKIVALAAVWLAVCLVMLFYFFKILDSGNEAQLIAMAGDRATLAVLQAERDSYNRAQQDLDQMAKESIQPDNFFSSDIAFVKELEILENLSQKLNVQFAISGISGTVATAAKAPTVTPLVTVPAGISLTGDLNSTMAYVETLENLSFITNVSGININSADKGNVSVNLTASLYLKQ